MGTSNYIIWIDQNISNDENTGYAQKLKSIRDYSFNGFKDIKSAIDFLKTIRFAGTKIIVSGKLYIDFIKQYKDNAAYLYTIPEIVIFTYRKELFIKANKDHQHILDNPLYKSGGIQTKFENIKNFITKK